MPARSVWKAAPVASALLTCMHGGARAAADETPLRCGLAEVVVTAQKRVENLQDVPLSIQAIGTEKLEQMNVTKLRRLREVAAERLVPERRPVLRAHLHARRRQRRRRQPLGLPAERRHVPR